MKKVFSFLGFLVLLAVFSLFAVLAIRPGDGGARLLDAEEPPYIGTVSSTDPSALARAFDHPFPLLPDSAAQGTVETRRYEGANARLLSLYYPDLTLQCVWPATAAPLLKRDGLTVVSLRSEEMNRFDVLSMPAVYAETEPRRCLYFSDESAAYALYTETLSRDDFLAAARRLKWQ